LIYKHISMLNFRAIQFEARKIAVPGPVGGTCPQSFPQIVWIDGRYKRTPPRRWKATAVTP
jgi:hypothetical protein